MRSCPSPIELQNLKELMEFAEEQGVPNSEDQVIKAYLTLQDNAPIGTEPETLDRDMFLAMMDRFGVFTKDGPNRTKTEESEPGSKDYYQDVENAFPEYKVVRTPIPYDKANANNIKARSAINILATQLSNNLNIPVRFITTEEAIELTKNVNRWSGQPAFFLGDTVYIIPDLATEESVLHEFAHPLIRSIYQNNTELFNKLFKDLLATSKGQEILERAKQQYPDIDENDPMIMEEALVMALTEAAVTTPDSQFNKFISNLLYAIKQLLRKIFGVENKVKVENLKATTTLIELADMLVMESFALDTKELSREDIAAYFTEVENLIKAAEPIDSETLVMSINSLYEGISQNLYAIRQNNNYEAMEEALKNYYNTSDLESIRRALAPFQTMQAFQQNELSRIQGDAAFEKNRVSNFVSSLLTLDHAMKKISVSIAKLLQDPNVKDNVAKVVYMNNMLSTWDAMLGEIQVTITKELANKTIFENNPIVVLVSNIRTQIATVQKQSNELYREGFGQKLKETLTPMKEMINEKFKSNLAYLIGKKASPERILQLQADYYGLRGNDLVNFLRLKDMVDNNQPMTAVQKNNYTVLLRESYKDGSYLNDEKIDMLMKGELGDASAMNSFLESYMNNVDPIVFGLAKYVKNNITDAFTRAQKLGNSFLTDIKPILQRAGFTQSNPAAFFEKLTFRDTKFIKNTDGTSDTMEVVSYINPWKNRSEQVKMRDALNLAKQQALASNDFSEVFRLQREQQEHNAKYYYRDYTDRYYERFKVFRKGENDVIGAKAESLRNDILAQIQNLTDNIRRYQQYGSNEVQDNQLALKALHDKLKDLYSDYDVVGKPKSEEDKLIAARLREHREASKDLYEMAPIEGFFAQALQDYENYLELTGYPKKLSDGTSNPAFIAMRNVWIGNNTRTKISDTWYNNQTRLFNEIEQLNSKIKKNPEISKSLLDAQKKLQDLLKKHKDENGQPNGVEMTLQVIAEIKQTEELIDSLKEQLENVSGATKAENEFLSDFFARLKSGEPITQYERDKAAEIQSKKQDGLTREERQRLNELYAELAEMKITIPTEYYLTILENILHNHRDAIRERIGTTSITADKIDDLINMEFYESVISKDPELKKWFDENHVIKTKEVSGKTITEIKRVKAWSVNRPSDNFYYEGFSFINSSGEEEFITSAVPSSEYYERFVKAEYVTQKVSISEAVEQGNVELANWDEKTNSWLPKLNVEDSPYKNDKYFELKKDKALFDALKVMLKWQFKFQENNTSSSRLQFEVPRYRKTAADSRLEYLRGGKKLENPISRWWRRMKTLYAASPDDYDRGYDMDDQVMLMEGELYNDENAGIPITGLSQLEADDVSLDLTMGMLKYMISGQKQQKLIEMNPMVRALQMSLKDPDNAIKSVREINKAAQRNRNYINLSDEALKTGKDKKRSVRVKAIDNFIEREFEGKANLGLFGGENEAFWITKMADNLTRLSAFGYFALDIPGSIRNNMSTRLQSLQEAIGGRYYNTKEWAQGTAWGNKVSMETSLQLYNFGPKSHDIQLTEIFNVFPNKFEESFADHGSRSLSRDAINDLSWMTSFRKLGEMNTAASIFAAMMYAEKNVKQTINGVTKNIRYMDAWETVDGQIRLKEGVDPEWGTEGIKFKQFQSKVTGVVNNLSGAYSKFDYAEADRYLAWRWLTTFRRYFTRMFMNRYAGLSYDRRRKKGKKFMVRYRFDASVEDTVMGFHVEAMRALFRGVKSRGEYLQTLTTSEKVALLKLTADIAYLIMFTMLISWAFGYSDDDEDRYKKIRARSGPLQIFGVAEGEAEFNLKGWLTNHAFLMSLQLRNETIGWLPITSVGFNNYADIIKFNSIATNNTTDTYKKMGSALMRHIGHTVFGTDDSKAYWDQREGPYSWQQEGGSKFNAYLLRAFGINARNVDSGTASVNWLKAQTLQ